MGVRKHHGSLGWSERNTAPEVGPRISRSYGLVLPIHRRREFHLEHSADTTLGRVTSATLVGVFLIFAWKMRRAGETAYEFQWLLSIALATTLLVIPMFPPNSQLLLLPAFMMLLRSIAPLWRGSQLSRFLVMVTTLSVFWPFLAAVSLVVGLIFLPGQPSRECRSCLFTRPCRTPYDVCNVAKLEKHPDFWNCAIIGASRVSCSRTRRQSSLVMPAWRCP